LHLPVLKILLNAGAFIFCLFVRILIQLFRSKRVFDFLAFIVLFLYFNVSKEYLLLGYILLRISEIERFCTDQISLSNE
jgi:hypothetical protein